MTRCRDVMTKDPAWCLSRDPVSNAAQLMKHEDVGSLPVLEEGQRKKVVGVVTDRDVVLNVLAENRPPETTPVADVMSVDPVTCHPDDPLERAVSAMAQHQIRRVPIVNDDGGLVGIIAQADIALNADDETTTAEVVKRISTPTPVHPSLAPRNR